MTALMGVTYNGLKPFDSPTVGDLKTTSQIIASRRFKDNIPDNCKETLCKERFYSGYKNCRKSIPGKK
jgi:hypothetical protein